MEGEKGQLHLCPVITAEDSHCDVRGGLRAECEQKESQLIPNFALPSSMPTGTF